jgi:hypothetical protein
MPILGSLSCSVVLANTSHALREYKPEYHNSAVETYLLIPSHRAQFHISLKADAYMSPGLAAFVFIDGKYQVNRSYRGFKSEGKTKFGVTFTGAEVSRSKNNIAKTTWWFDGLQFGSSPFIHWY